MFARIYNKSDACYYKSIVYGTIEITDSFQYIVINPSNNHLELVDYLDNSKQPAIPLVEIIQNKEDSFKTYEKAFLLKYKHYCKENSKSFIVNRMRGYSDICENYELITDLLEKRSVSVDKYNVQLCNLTDSDEWIYIKSQEDANDFMRKVAGFHDSTLDKLIYKEENGYTQITATFDTCGWCEIVELCFEAIQALNIRPAKENNYRWIYIATLLVNDESIFWADSYMKNEDLSYTGSFIKALNLKWRQKSS